MQAGLNMSGEEHWGSSCPSSPLFVRLHSQLSSGLSAWSACWQTLTERVTDIFTLVKALLPDFSFSSPELKSVALAICAGHTHLAVYCNVVLLRIGSYSKTLLWLITSQILIRFLEQCLEIIFTFQIWYISFLLMITLAEINAFKYKWQRKQNPRNYTQDTYQTNLFRSSL